MSKLERLEQGLAAGQWVPLSPEAEAAPIAQLPPGTGVVVRSGGSSGGSRCCAQPSLHLDRSAAATAATTAHQHPRARRQLSDGGRVRLGRQGHPLPRRQPLLQPLDLAHAAAAQTISGSSENNGPAGVQPGAKPGAAGVGPWS